MALIIESESVAINIAREAAIPRILLLSSELNARARLAAALPDTEITVLAGERWDLEPRQGDLAVVDLDERGAQAIEALRGAGFGGRIVAFFSHVNRDLGRTAAAAGADVYPRGAFWKDLSRILA